MIRRANSTRALCRVSNKRARNSEQLPSLLDRLECNSDSIIVIAIAQPEVRNFCRFTWAWLSKAERQTQDLT